MGVGPDGRHAPADHHRLVAYRTREGVLDVSDLLVPLTAAQFRSKAVAVITALGGQPQRWAPGGVASSILTAACTIAAMLSTSLSNAIAAQWNPTSTGDDLVLLSKYFYGFTPPEATFASGKLTLTNTGGGVYTFGAGQAVFGSTVANAQGVFPTYVNVNAFTLNSNATLTIDVQCVFIGSAGNSAPGFVTQLVTAMLGVTANNPAPILGLDALEDDELRQLNVDSLAVQSVFGPRGAFAYAIRTAQSGDPTSGSFVPGVPVNINRWKISTSSRIGQVTIYICGPDGTTTTNDQIGVAWNIEQLARPDGVQVLPSTVTLSSGQVLGAPAPATPVTYQPSSILLTVLGPKGTTPQQVQTVVLAALDAWFASPSNPIGGIAGTGDAGPMVGIFESGVSGVCASAVAGITGCTQLSSQFTGTGANAPSLPLTTGQVAVNGISSATLKVVVQTMS